MIDVIKQTPYEYSKQSRDYQKLARIYTILYNLCKMYIDNMKVWNSDIDNKLTPLRAKTLNFDPVHSWDLDSLEAAVSCFKYLMMKKGTITALKSCLTILMRSQGIYGEQIEPEVNGNNIIIKIPEQLASAGVVEDLFEYLLPSGSTYRIIEYQETSFPDNNTLLGINETTSHEIYESSELGIYMGESSDDSYNQGATWYKNAVNPEVPNDRGQ